MLSILFVFLASMCNSIMDTVDHHFNESIFSLFKNKKIRLWFNEDRSWLNKYVDRDVSKGFIKWNILGLKINKPVQISDAWHFFKTIMIFMFCFGVIFYFPFITYFAIWIDLLIELAILGFIWNTTFSLFYNRLLKLKFWNFIFKINV